MRSISQAIKIAASLLVMCLVLLLILPDVSSFPKWPDRPSRAERLAERQSQAAPPAPAPARQEEPPAQTDDAPPEPEPEPQAPPEPQPAPEQPAGDPERIFHRAVAVTATDFEADGLRISLAGVESLPFEETCRLGTLSAPCGAQARTALRGWLRGRSLSCDVPADAREGGVEATCHVGGEDVARWVVMQGWARPTPGSAYESAAESARRDERGLWRYDGEGG
ncbi:thermonuclease family protein [Aureimonas altamirensis]|uniref:thermonuclease family protein n=1 Tax=Aureimonas altamirensis TaxID=370622 RepID=UPI0020370879|nr:thermonuclease family protein [Aureimonas altamirensis]MCM2504520.1 thermonuclease family protein [Aureimonas altamirensis]